MRLALMVLVTATLAACSTQEGPAGPERRSAAGEVLGGEVSDAMLPTDTVRSASPAGISSPDADTATAAGKATATPSPRPTLEAAPMPDMTMPADPPPMPPED